MESIADDYAIISKSPALKTKKKLIYLVLPRKLLPFLKSRSRRSDIECTATDAFLATLGDSLSSSNSDSEDEEDKDSSDNDNNGDDRDTPPAVLSAIRKAMKESKVEDLVSEEKSTNNRFEAEMGKKMKSSS